MMKYLSTVLFIFLLVTAKGQNVGIGTNNPHPSAKLDVSSEKSGFLPPRMTSAQRDSIINPSPGLMIYCINCGSNGEWQGFDGSEWTNMNGLRAQSSEYAIPFTQIGDQIWMKKNLDVSKYRNGDIIPQIKDSAEWANATYGAWCYYNNDPYFGEKYGKLYNWYAVNDPRGLAPQGWHVPSELEFKKLILTINPINDTSNIITGRSFAGGEQLKDTGTIDWISPNSLATNSTGYTGLPAGTRGGTNFFGLKSYGIWWLASNFDSLNARYFYLYNINSNIFFGRTIKKYALSVRCIADSNRSGLSPQLVSNNPPATPDISFVLSTNILNTKKLSIIDKGYCWSISPNPTINSGNKTSDGTGSGIYRSRINGLSYNTLYYLRPFITTPEGAYYGKQININTCDGTYINFSNTIGNYEGTYDDLNNKYYKTNITSLNQTSPTTANISVFNLLNVGGGPVELTLDWTDPTNRKVIVVENNAIANSNAGIILGPSYEGKTLSVRSAPGENGTFSSCTQSFEFKVQIGITDVGWFSNIFTVRIEK